MTTIITKNSSTAGDVPATSELVQGELAVNVTDKKLYTKNSSGAVVSLVSSLDTNNPIGTGNVTLGSDAGDSLTSNNNYNTLIGNDAGKALTTGTSHVAVGYKALETSTAGTGNVAVGPLALQDSNSTNFATAVGWGAGKNVTTGGLSSTFIGNGAGLTITTGTQNTCIGQSANPTSATASYQFTLGSTDIQTLRCNQTSITSLSDARDKTDIVDTPYGLDFINTLKPRQFKWDTRDGNIKDGTLEQGFIAQELLESAKGNNNALNLVLEDNPNKLEASAGNLIPLLVKAVQELSARVVELETK
jgi:trimeric autotransporter adhesin